MNFLLPSAKVPPVWDMPIGVVARGAARQGFLFWGPWAFPPLMIRAAAQANGVDLTPADRALISADVPNRPYKNLQN